MKIKIKEIKKGLSFTTGISSKNGKTFYKEVIRLKEKKLNSFIELLDEIFDLYNNLILKDITEIKEEIEEDINEENEEIKIEEKEKKDKIKENISEIKE